MFFELRRYRTQTDARGKLGQVNGGRNLPSQVSTGMAIHGSFID
jgi:hypothetical protein